MIDRTEILQTSINDFLKKHDRSPNRVHEDILTNLGTLFMDVVYTPQYILVGRLETQIGGRGRRSRLSAFIDDKSRNHGRQLWIPFISVETGVTYAAEIVATEEKTILEGWRAAQSLLELAPVSSEQTLELLQESRNLLKTIGAMSLDQTDRVQETRAL